MKRLILLCTVLIMLAAPAVHATTAMLTGKVVRTLVADNGRWGGCMVFLDVNISTKLPSCPSRWVTFSCSGTFTTKDVASRMLDSAQMAKALGRTVRIQVDDTKKHNGYCYGSRIDVL